jgi:hypothetical protein
MPLAPAVRRMPKRAVHAPLFPTIAQQRLWFLDQLEPGNPAYNVPVAYHVQGRLNVAALAQSINAIVHRHEVLRTAFPAELGCPMQVIAPSDTVHDTPRSLQDIVVPLYGASRSHQVLMRTADICCPAIRGKKTSSWVHQQAKPTHQPALPSRRNWCRSGRISSE